MLNAILHARIEGKLYIMSVTTGIDRLARRAEEESVSVQEAALQTEKLNLLVLEASKMGPESSKKSISSKILGLKIGDQEVSDSGALLWKLKEEGHVHSGDFYVTDETARYQFRMDSRGRFISKKQLGATSAHHEKTSRGSMRHMD